MQQYATKKKSYSEINNEVSFKLFDFVMDETIQKIERSSKHTTLTIAGNLSSSFHELNHIKEQFGTIYFK